MPGGLMQLLAVGAQDQYITVSPEMTYFKQKYKRPTNFSMQSVETTFVSTPPLTIASRVQYTCKIPRVGDLLKDVFLALQLPDIYVEKNPGDGPYYDNGSQAVQGQPRFRWIPKIGNYIVYSYSLVADTTVLDQKWGEFDDVWNDLTMPLDKLTTYNRMIGNEALFEIPNVYKKSVIVSRNNKLEYYDYPYSDISTTPAIPTISGRRLYIPLNFWFSKSAELALPLVSLQYQVVTITIEFRMLEDLFQFYDPWNKIYISPSKYRSLYGGTWAIGDYLEPNIVNTNKKKTTLDLTPYLECNYVFLDTPERTYIATNSFDYLVENVYRTETSGIQNIYTIDLHIANPIKEILWITRRADIFNYNDWANLTASIPQDNTQSALSSAKILWNGIDRFDIKSSRYFNLLQPYQYHTASPREGIYTYSFALEPEKIQPSGSFNASTINKTQLYITMNPYTSTGSSLIDGPANTEYTVIVYSIYYNIFRVMSGSGAMVFAS